MSKRAHSRDSGSSTAASSSSSGSAGSRDKRRGPVRDTRPGTPPDLGRRMGRTVSSAAAKRQGGGSTRVSPQEPDVIGEWARRLQMGRDALLAHLAQSAAAACPDWSVLDAQRLLRLCGRLGLDPLGGEAYLLRAGPGPEGATAGSPAQSVPRAALLVLSLDGWCRLINEHPMFDGLQFSQAEPGQDGLPQWIECTIHRKDRAVPTTVREYMEEARQPHGAWLSHPRRMLRHKALVQCARVCFALGGLHEPDEAELVSRNRAAQSAASQARPLGLEGVKAWVSANPPPGAAVGGGT